MYSLSNLFTLLRDPRRLIGVVHQLGLATNRAYYRKLFDHVGCDVMAEDWDNLLILDGCRYDLFEETCSLDGVLESRTSHASDSSEFLHRNFAEETFHDTVYVTANPHVFELPDDTFHATISLLDEKWDSTLQTVRPDTVADALRDAAETYPNKRLIGHFMQPHYPFIGELGQKLEQGGIARFDHDGSKITDTTQSDIWTQKLFRLTNASRDEIWDGYRENLEIVLDEVSTLLPHLTGKTVLTSDHGNLVGDWIGPIPCRGYGHPPGIYCEKLVRTPWFTIESEEQKTVCSEHPVRSDTLAEDAVEERLADLGYT